MWRVIVEKASRAEGPDLYAWFLTILVFILIAGSLLGVWIMDMAALERGCKI